MAYEVVTTQDKVKRDQMFQELRNSTTKIKRRIKGEMVDVVVPHPTESQVVKFSGVEELTPISRDVKTKQVIRPTYRSTFSVAYPTS